jgi:hypothetical protein
MKVRHKQHIKTEYEVIEESPSYYIAWIITEGVKWGPTMCKKEEFEPIPTETWRDVSDDCLTDLQGALCYAPQFLEKRLANPLPDGFRLVKKPLVNLEFLPKYAFFIEKRDA